MKALTDIVRAQSLKTLWDHEYAKELLHQWEQEIEHDWWTYQDQDQNWIKSHTRSTFGET